MDKVSISRYNEPTSYPIKGKVISSTRITNNRLEICHAKSKQQQAKGFHGENNQSTLN